MKTRRVQPVLQTEGSECGLACLVMIARSHGRKVALPLLREKIEVSVKGMSVRTLVEAGAFVGLAGRAMRVQKGGMEYVKLPCVIQWKANHFVVLERIRGGRYDIVDTTVGRSTLSEEEFWNGFTGVVAEYTPLADYVEDQRKPDYSFGRVVGRLVGFKSAMARVLVVACAMELLALIAPMFTQIAVDDAIPEGDSRLVLVAAAGFALLLGLQTLLQLARGWMLLRVEQSMSLQWVGNLVRHLLCLPMPYFEKRHQGDLVSRFQSIMYVNAVVAREGVGATLDAGMLLIAAIFMISYSWQLALVVMISSAAYVVVKGAQWRMAREASQDRLAAEGRETNQFVETMRNMQAIKLFGRQQAMFAKWLNIKYDLQDAQRRSQRTELTNGAANTVIVGLETLAVVAIGSMQVMDTANRFSMGMFVAFLGYKTLYSSRFTQVVDFLFALRLLGTHVDRIADIALAKREADSEEGMQPTRDLSELTPSIELKDVWFRYSSSEAWVLEGANLRIEGGEHVAIIGPSGAGKTTVLKLILGLVEPHKGEVLYGGHPIHALGVENVRRMIGTVMQDDSPFAGRLVDNVAFFDDVPSLEKVIDCCKLAALDEEIRAMPMGYHTRLGDMGHGMSGGQKQRLLLARAMYGSPKVVALDEATSNLDIDSERKISSTLKSLGVTRIVVAHRPETIRTAGRVVELVGKKLQTTEWVNFSANRPEVTQVAA